MMAHTSLEVVGRGAFDLHARSRCSAIKARRWSTADPGFVIYNVESYGILIAEQASHDD